LYLSTMKLIVSILWAAMVGLPAGVAMKESNVAHGDKTVGKVITMLEDMLKKGKEDADKDRDLYAKFKCYCDKNQKEKSENIEDNEKKIKKLGSSIDKLRAENGELSTECGQLKADIATNKDETETAESVRKKANEDFKAEEEDMKSAIDAMEKALEVLSSIGSDQKATELLTVHSAKNFMGNLGKNSLLKLRSTLKTAMMAASEHSASVHLTQKLTSAFQSFMQAPFTGDYQSQSGEIVGILKNMKDTFEANLEQAQSSEKKAEEAHEKLMKIKKEELETMEKNFEEKQGTLGSNDETLSTDLDTFETAKTELKDDTEFLSKLAPMCDEKEKQFGKRKMMRANEEAAIGQAIAILKGGADTFKKTEEKKFIQTASFIQIRSYNGDLSSVRKAVGTQLQVISRRMQSLKLARVAAMLEMGNPFSAVLDEIKKMLVLLDEEQKSDEEQKAWCEQERDENNKLKEEELEPKIEKLENMIDELDSDINAPEEGLKDSIKSTEGEINANREAQGEETAARKEENTAYTESVRNFDDAQAILNKAITVLKEFYDSMKKEKKESLLIQKEDPEPPEAFEDDYEGQSGKGNDVIEMIEFILKESEDSEAEVHKDEESSQHAYEDSMQTLKDEQAELEETLAKQKEELAEKVKSLAEARDDLTVTEKALLEVERYLLKIKDGCDFIVDNFDKRKENRGKEKDALKKAVKTLKGTPAFKKAELAAEQESWGDCKDTCMEDKEHAKCKACLAGVSVPGYCVTHKDTPGC